MQVYYFTRTGRCEKIADSIAVANGVQSLKIEDGKDWGGKLNFVKAGAAAAKKESIKATYQKLSDEGEVVLVFPIWAGTFPPGVRGFIEENDTKRITLVAVSAATSLGESEKSMFKKVYEIKGKDMNPPAELMK